MKKSIIIGSNGYIGKHLSYFLDANGFDNSNYDVHATSVIKVNKYEQLNIFNKEDVNKLNPNVDFIFLFAGLTGTFDGFNNYKEFI